MKDLVVIGGCGRVGLPLSLCFAGVGKHVVAYDIDEAKVRQVRSGIMPFRDKGADSLLKEVLASGHFSCTADPAAIRDAETLIVVIGTPVDEHLNPRFDIIQDLIRAHRTRFQAGQLLILRSTVYPGTTDRIHALLKAEGLSMDVAVCPERVAQGVALDEIRKLPQIVAGCTARAQQRAEDLFRSLGVQTLPMNPISAELTKLFTNAWRYIQFAVANQFYMIAQEHDVNFYEIHRAMTQDYPRAAGMPTAGFAAGPCLFKDTMQLSAFHNNAFALGHSAMLVNEGLPNFLIQKAAKRVQLRGSTAGILGMTFKADCDDTRDSLSFKLRRILQAECREVLCTDPFASGNGFLSLEEVLRRSDVLFLGVPHEQYRALDLRDTPVVDVWNFLRTGTRIA